jgi:hypothetical protein
MPHRGRGQEDECDEDEEDREDEGFGEGSVGSHQEERDRAREEAERVLRDALKRGKRGAGLAPAAVIVKIVRELEADFAHYKRFVSFIPLALAFTYI